MRKKPRGRNSARRTSHGRRLKPLNSFRSMERLIASTEELAHLQGMSVVELLIAANAMTAAALRQLAAERGAVPAAGPVALANGRHSATH